MMMLEPAEPTISASKLPSSSQSADRQVPSQAQPTEKRPAQRQGDVRRIYSIIVTALSNVVHTALVMGKKVHRVAMLLTTGYNSPVSQRKYEKSQDWHQFRSTLLLKIENIGVVSGLLLASSSNLLIAGELRRMTHVATMASIYGSIISIVSGMLCAWLLVGSHATNLKHLLRHRLLFYYLYATPSLFGGASALTFFVAVGSWTWLDQAANDDAWAGRILAVVLSAILMGNAVGCFVLGARNYTVPDDDEAAGHQTTNTDGQSCT